MKQPSYRIENGRKIYSMECRIDAVRRNEIPLNPPLSKGETKEGTHASPPEDDKGANLAVPPNQGITIISQNAVPDPDTVRMRFRLLSAVDAWLTMGWLGTQLVRYGHLDGAAIRQLPEIINGRARPVPLMWNHSYDMKDRAGRVEHAEWEASNDIPPGVNGDLVVNRKYDDKAAMGLETGEIDATSISVVFDMERSHPEMSFERFLNEQGEEVEGQKVAWLPTAAKEVLHHAMVWSGADPNSGPRETVGATHASSDNTAEAVNSNQKRGGVTVEKQLLEILASLCEEFGIEVTLSEGVPIPEDLQQRLMEKVNELKASTVKLRGEMQAVIPKVNHMYETIQSMAPHVLKAGEEALASAEILERLPARVELAVHGERYVQDLKDQALSAFDTAKFVPGKDQTLEMRSIRTLIEQCSGIDELKAWISEYGPMAQAKLGPKADMRSSKGEELPKETKAAALYGRDLDIAESSTRMFGGRKEG